jgi:glycerol-1-phosphatase
VDESVTWRSTDRPLAEVTDLLLLDLDGVIYVGADAVPGAAASLERAASAGLARCYVTNNASRPPDVVAAHLRRLGIAARSDDVMTSAQAGARLLVEKLAPGSAVLAVGGPGVAAALVEVGLTPVTSWTEGVPAVIQGYGPDVGWRQLAEATYAVRAGAMWVATNTDATVPTPRGAAPGNGQLVAVVARTTGVDPLVTGKPGPQLFLGAVQRAQAQRALVVGDRLDTDIAGAVAAGLPSLVVLTGISGPAELLAATPAERPTYLGADLAALWETQPSVDPAPGGWRCRSSSVVVEGGQLRVEQEGDPLDLLRACCAAAWSASDARHPLDLSAATTEVERLLGRR